MRATRTQDSATPQRGLRDRIVNANNKVGNAKQSAKATIKKLFLKNQTQWPDGTRARPYGRKDTSAAQTAFIASVLGMSDAELARHWLRVRNMNGTTPPKKVGSNRMVLKHVARHAGAFAVIELDVARRASGVRVLMEF